MSEETGKFHEVDEVHELLMCDRNWLWEGIKVDTYICVLPHVWHNGITPVEASFFLT